MTWSKCRTLTSNNDNTIFYDASFILKYEMEVIKPLLSIPFYLKDVSNKKLIINVVRDILNYEQWLNNVWNRTGIC